MSEQTFTLGGRRVSSDSIPAFLPDIDVYFKGNVKVAKELILALRDAGAEFVKGALLHSAELCYGGDIEATFFKREEGVVRERYRTIIERHAVPLAAADEIYAFARDVGMKVVLSVYDAPGVEFCVRHEVAGIKIPSSNITHPYLIRLAAATRIPMIVDTGKSTLNEIDRAIEWAIEGGARHVAVQHSPEAPPAPTSRHYLRMIPFLSERYGLEAGLSDHHIGGDMLLAAVALGATFVEKGVCADDAEPDIDLAHAARISEVRGLLARIADVWTALGRAPREFPADRPTPVDRMSVVASTTIARGEPLTLNNVRFVFAAPPSALSAAAWDQLDGCPATMEIAENTPIEARHVEPVTK